MKINQLVKQAWSRSKHESIFCGKFLARFKKQNLSCKIFKDQDMQKNLIDKKSEQQKLNSKIFVMKNILEGALGGGIESLFLRFLKEDLFYFL